MEPIIVVALVQLLVGQLPHVVRLTVMVREAIVLGWVILATVVRGAPAPKVQPALIQPQSAPASGSPPPTVVALVHPAPSVTPRQPQP